MTAPSGNDLAYWGRMAMNGHQRAASDTLFDDQEPGTLAQRECVEVVIADCLIALFKGGKSKWTIRDLFDVAEQGFLQAQRDIEFCRGSTRGWAGPIEHDTKENDAERLEH